ncbi:hypothetical protein [Haloferax sp. DFSO60]|uniref:hypothetical protein n=1 Tax=Haloferax sp. DFSO60 TaxID=3388652 RepID=UPI00397D34FD
MKIELELEPWFKEGIENGDLPAGARIRYVVGDTYLDGGPSEFRIDEPVVFTLRRLCEGVVDVLNGERFDLSYLFSAHMLHLDPVDDTTVSVWTSSSGPAETDIESLVRGVVVTADELVEYVTEVNPAFETASEIETLRSASKRLRVEYTDRFGEIP